MSKRRKEEYGLYSVPMRVTLRGSVMVSARDAEEAKRLADDISNWQSDDFSSCAEIVDYFVTGQAERDS